MWRLALQLKADKAVDVLKGLKTKVAQMKSEEQRSSCTSVANQTKVETSSSFANEAVHYGCCYLVIHVRGEICLIDVRVLCRKLLQLVHWTFLESFISMRCLYHS